jgi:hypothetical protein
MTKRTDDIILSRIDELKDDIKVFRSDAEQKINHTRDVIKDEITIRFDFIQKEITKLDVRLEKIEKRNEMLDNHEFRIECIEKDFYDLDKQFQYHIKRHSKNAPKLAINRFQVITMWSMLGLIATWVLTKITGIWDKIFR